MRAAAFVIALLPVGLSTQISNPGFMAPDTDLNLREFWRPTKRIRPIGCSPSAQRSAVWPRLTMRKISGTRFAKMR